MNHTQNARRAFQRMDLAVNIMSARRGLFMSGKKDLRVAESNLESAWRALRVANHYARLFDEVRP